MIGELNQVFGEHTQALIRHTIDLIRPTGKAIGVSTNSFDPAVTGFWHNLEINIISSGTNYDYIPAERP